MTRRRAIDVTALKLGTGFAVVSAFVLIGLHWTAAKGYYDGQILQRCRPDARAQDMPGDVSGAVQPSVQGQALPDMR